MRKVVMLMKVLKHESPPISDVFKELKLKKFSTEELEFLKTKLEEDIEAAHIKKEKEIKKSDALEIKVAKAQQKVEELKKKLDCLPKEENRSVSADGTACGRASRFHPLEHHLSESEFKVFTSHKDSSWKLEISKVRIIEYQNVIKLNSAISALANSLIEDPNYELPLGSADELTVTPQSSDAKLLLARGLASSNLFTKN